jgi:3-deoxy-D-manno-octulosonate 8-phosphate phosphatase (KDO 8-P phosphatase)
VPGPREIEFSGADAMGLDSIRAVILDVDGVLTDGCICVGDDGGEWKHFHVQDGAGIKHLLEAGIEVAWLSGRRSKAVEHRAEELGVRHVRQDAKKKIPVYDDLLQEFGLDDQAVCYVGDDLTDLPVVRRAGLGVAVADARPEVKEAADLVTEAPGGRGAVRELAERILQAQGQWETILARYRS